jgi:hypothetical protein
MFVLGGFGHSGTSGSTLLNNKLIVNFVKTCDPPNEWSQVILEKSFVI